MAQAVSVETAASVVQKPNCACCNKPIVSGEARVRFPCPKCTKYPIVRCLQCRKNAVKYACPQCGFEGPN